MRNIESTTGKNQPFVVNLFRGRPVGQPRGMNVLPIVILNIASFAVKQNVNNSLMTFLTFLPFYIPLFFNQKKYRFGNDILSGESIYEYYEGSDSRQTRIK